MEVITLDKLDFKNYPDDKKKEAFASLDAMMKLLHEEDKMVPSFLSKDQMEVSRLLGDIAYDYKGDFYYFSKFSPINSFYVDSKEDAVYENVMNLARFTLYMYLRDNNLPVLPDPTTIAENFDRFRDCFPIGDADYYKSILVDAYKDHKLPEVKYYTDYLNKKSHDLTGNNNSMVMVKATAVGKAWAREDEAAFTNTFLLLLSTLSITVALIMGIVFLGIHI